MTVVNSSFANPLQLKMLKYLASIYIEILNFQDNKGTCRCTHRRGLSKFTQELCDFEISDGTIRAKRHGKSKSIPSTKHETTFRLDVTEEEKQMREQTPMPFEHRGNSLITVEPEDYISSDEEGDQDLYV